MSCRRMRSCWCGLVRFRRPPVGKFSDMREGALELTRALDFSVQIANAVDHAHSNNVIHRDLRPGNVLVSEHGLVKVADFGTSRVLEIAAHGTTVIGSPPYMSAAKVWTVTAFEAARCDASSSISGRRSMP